MPIKPERQYRTCKEFRTAETEENAFIVEGYASTFEPYVMAEDGETQYFEKIDPHAFDNTDMSDVILQYDHEGRVYARRSNGTLEVSVDDHGLKVRADLSKTEGARALYEDIKSGMITQMSFAFTIAHDSYNTNSHTRTIDAIKRLYDVSAVSIPANPGTEISARNYFGGVIEAERAECAALEARKRKAKAIIVSMGVKFE